MATYYVREGSAREITPDDLENHAGLSVVVPLVEDLRAATRTPLLCNGMLGWNEPIFSRMHVSTVSTLMTPLERLCPFAPMADLRDAVAFQKIHHNMVATPTQVQGLTQRWMEAKDAALEAERTTRLKIPEELRALIYRLEIPGDPSSLDPDNTIFALQLAPWQGIYTLLTRYVRLQRVVNFLSAYVNYTRAYLYLTTTP